MTSLPMVGYPRPLTTIHQIEPTSFCNLKCQYCPSPQLDKLRGRKREYITMDHFKRALEWCKHFAGEGTQKELSLTGIGESLLHDDFVEMVRLAREALPDNYICFSTNGLLLNDGSQPRNRPDLMVGNELLEALQPYLHPSVNAGMAGIYISLHRPEKAGRAIEHAKKWGLLAAVNASAATQPFDWAGQIDWVVSDSIKGSPCAYLREGWGVVMVHGAVTRCCLDATGAGIMGHVDDEPGSINTSPFSLCGPCHMEP